MKGARLQAVFARKRENEQLKIEKSAAVQKYYDKWGRITSKYEQWTAPQYYRDTEENHKKRLEKEQHQKNLEKRQTKLKELLDEENKFYDKEMNEKLNPRINHIPNSLLENVRQSLFTADENKKRNDLESKLYTKLRLGINQEEIIRESKSDHQAFAKLSWLDRQIEKQMIQEKEKRENNELELKLQQEKRKHEEFMQNTHQMRESEIRHLKGMQETHVLELKNRERESHDLKLQENLLRKKLLEIKKEIESISTTGRVRRDRVVALNNYRKLKMLMQSRCEAVQRELRQDINLLDRISFDKDFDNGEEIGYLRKKFQAQLENETQNQRNIEMMYESEAKHSLVKQEEQWNDDAMIREQQLKCLMDNRMETINDQINAIIKRQHDLISLRESHLKAIEETNDRLKNLMNLSVSDEYNNLTKSDINGNIEKTNELTSLCNKTNNMMIRQNTDYCIPKFGRKRVVWT